MLRFTATLLIAAAGAQLIGIYAGWLSSPHILSLATNAFMAIITLTVFRIVSQISDKIRFTQVYIATIVIKLLAACSFAVVVVLLDQNNAQSNVIFLLILYALFTAIEVGFLVPVGRSNHS